MAQVGVRKFLTDNGYKDSDVTWDPNRSTVQVQGRDFGQYTPQADGNTYGDYGSLSNSLNGLRSTKRNAELDGLVNSLVQKSQSPTPGFQYQAPTPFQYNPQSDQRYQNALQQAQQGANTATNNAMVALGRRGIGNSSSATTQANGIQQNAMAKVNTELLPQFMQQAYGQWADQANRDLQVQQANYGAQRDQQGDLTNLAQFMSGLSQQDFNNQLQTNQASQQKKDSNIALAQWLSSNYGISAVPKDDAGVAFDQVKGMQPLNAVQQAFQQLLQSKQFDYGKEQDAIQNTANYGGTFNNQPTVQKQAQDFNQKITQQNANTSAAKAYSSGSGGTSVTQQRYNDQQSANEFEGRIFDELSQLDPSEVSDWLEMNRGEIARQLGTSGFDKIKKSITAPSQQESKQTSDVRKQAINLAKNDPDWYDEASREQLIQEYMGYLK